MYRAFAHFYRIVLLNLAACLYQLIIKPHLVGLALRSRYGSCFKNSNAPQKFVYPHTNNVNRVKVT
jgi:hypothetical protein